MVESTDVDVAAMEYYEMRKRELEKIKKDDSLRKNSKKVESVDYIMHKNYRQTSFWRRSNSAVVLVSRNVIFLLCKCYIRNSG